VYFSPLHKHWVIGAFSLVGEDIVSIPMKINGCPVYPQDTPAVHPTSPSAPPDILGFFINPSLMLTEEEIADIRYVFPGCSGINVRPWGHISLFFRMGKFADATMDEMGLPARLGGLTYSFEVKSYEQLLVGSRLPLGSNVRAFFGRITERFCAYIIRKIRYRNAQE
jgi:hypothetical protein